MARVVAATLALAAPAVAGPRPVGAQRLAQPAGGRAVRAASRLGVPAPRPALGAEGRPSAAPYVWGGAAVGVLAMGAGLAIYFRQTKAECVCSPVGFAPAFAGAAALGAGAGYVAYRLVRR